MPASRTAILALCLAAAHAFRAADPSVARRARSAPCVAAGFGGGVPATKKAKGAKKKSADDGGIGKGQTPLEKQWASFTQLVEEADGGGRRLLELIKRRLSSVDELAAVRLVASIDVALMVDGDDVRAENERLRAAAEDALRHVRTPFRAEAARLEVGVARSARNAARFADRDRRYRLFGFSILAAVSFLVSRAARFASAGRGAKSAFDLIPAPEAFPVL